MRVLVVSAMYPDRRDPVRGAFVRDQLDAVRAAAPDITFKVIAPTVRRLGFPWNGLRFLQLAWLAGRACLSGGFDLVHAHGLAPTGHLARLVARARRVPLLITAHGSDVERSIAIPRLGRLARRAAAAADTVIAVSRHLADRMKDGLGIESEVVYLGIDLPESIDKAEARRQLAIRPAVESVLFVGNLVPVKGPDLLLAAFRLVIASRPTARLSIVGDGPLRPTVEAAAAADGRHLEYLGRLERPQLMLRLAAADLLVMPSRSEALGLVGLEALALGTPVVGSSLGGASDYIDDGVEGRLVDPNDQAALSGAISQMLADSEGRDAMGQAGRRRAEGFGRAAWTDRLIEIYRRSAASGATMAEEPMD